MNNSELWVQCWNINGTFQNINGFTYNKLQDPDFTAHTKNAKILGLIETQHIAEDIDKLQINDFKCFQVCRKKKKFGRKHGGIAVFVHNTILGGVKLVATQGSESIILKLDKQFFQLDNETYLIFVYCSPANSSYCSRTGLDPFQDLEQKLIKLETNSEKIILGDLNARTGNKLDYIEDEDNSDLILPGDYRTDSVATFPRGNMDKGTNTYGDALISLCKNVPLRICNGRKLGDIQGQYTCHKWNGQSSVDYCLSSPDTFQDILFLKIGNLVPLLSDHCSTMIAIKCKFYLNFQGDSNYEFIKQPKKLSWDSNIALKFENNIQTQESKNFLEHFAINGIKHDQECVDCTTEFLTDFLVSAAEIAGNNGSQITLFKGKAKGADRNWKFRRKPNRKIMKPKWHDATCESLSKDINKTASLLKKYPNNPFLRGRIQSDSKKYKKLVKSKHKAYINNLFKELDILHHENPRGYMNIVKSLRDGSFDCKKTDDSAFITPEKWAEHFSSLLGPKIPPTPQDKELCDFIDNNLEKFESELGSPFTRSEFLAGVSSLANNKATSFDRISNEILKTSKLVIVRPALTLFNTILSSGIYPTQWKFDILTPIHKSGVKNDPNNFRGVAVSSCFGKLFNKLLQKRLDKLCSTKGHISDEQGSSRAGSRTSDHLLIVKFLIDKYVKQRKKYLYTCFVDLRKAFDTVPRTRLFYCLLNDYAIGGKFLKLLQEMYKNNQIFVKLSDGLLKPFTTTISVKQGCVFSPILFNLYIGKICEVFDQSCCPVTVNNRKINSLLWADDLLLISESPKGLQNCINKMESFYTDLGLQINIKKTKIIVFNKRGINLGKKFNFYLNGARLEVTDNYQYLGIKLRPSGSLKMSTEELHDKASRAWFGISNIIHKNKRMENDKVFGIFDSLITPIATYASEFWLPFTLSKTGLNSFEKFFDTWGLFRAETINQKCARLFLSVHSKASRLAVLGELGRYPLFITSLSQCLNFKLSLISRATNNNLIGHMLKEMKIMSENNQDCWLTRVNQMENLLKLPQNMKYSKSSGKNISSILKGKFEYFWKTKINECKMNNDDNLDHNKLRVYRQFKSSFSAEPYITLVRNRNQRSSLTRMRISAHLLASETLRRTRPVTPLSQRFCAYCQTGSDNDDKSVDTEHHFIMDCKVFKNTRNNLFEKLSSAIPGFKDLSDHNKFVTLMCPVNPQVTKQINRYIKYMFVEREKIDLGGPITEL